MKHHLVVFALVTLASEVFAVQGTLVTESEELKGDIRWNAEKKHYVVAIRKGKSIINMQRQSEDIVRLDIPEPPALEKALTLIEKGSRLPRETRTQRPRRELPQTGESNDKTCQRRSQVNAISQMPCACRPQVSRRC